MAIGVVWTTRAQSERRKILRFYRERNGNPRYSQELAKHFRIRWVDQEWGRAMEFEWDPVKDKANVKRHGVAFSDAALIFADLNMMTLYDKKHSRDEDRYLSLGRTPRGQVLLVSHTERESGDAEMIRIISARPADEDEEAVY